MKTILLATDFSARSDLALERATQLARQHGARLVLLHVIDVEHPQRMVDAERPVAEQMLAELGEKVRSAEGLACVTIVTNGNPHEAIIAAADETGSDLVVMGTHRRHALKDLFVGTTVERVIRTGSRPVLVAAASPKETYATVLVATDMSDASARAVEAARDLGFLENARVGVVHGFEAPAQGIMLRASMTMRDLQQYISSRRAEAVRELSVFLRKLRFKPNFRMVELPELSTAMLIDACAREQKADLVVVGTQGRTALGRFLLGSVAEEVLRGSSVDVLAVPAYPASAS